MTNGQPSIKDILDRIDAVIKNNKKTEWIFISLTIIIFLCGISCFIIAIVSKQFAWSTPSAIATLLLYWPLKQIRNIRRENIALATVPMLVTLLPPGKAAEEIQKLINKLYEDKENGRRPN